MSNSSNDSAHSRSDGQRRSTGRRRNRNNRGGNRGKDRGGQRSGNRGPQGRRPAPSGPRRPKPAPLTLWQKILKVLGLYDPNKPPKRTTPSRVQQPPAAGGSRKSDGAKPGPERKSRTRNARASQKPVETNRLYVGNLSFDASEKDLEELFKGAGTVDTVEIVYNRNTERSKGYAFVEMGSVDDAKHAVETLHDQTFMERQLIVSGAKSKGPANKGSGNQGSAKGDPAPVATDIKPPEEDLVDERLGPDEPREII